MVWPLLSVLLIFVLLCMSESLWRAGLVRGERGRKLVHITVGTFIAFWPFYMSFQTIQLLSLAFLLTILISQKYHIFHAIHAVKRRTWGEVLFAVSIGMIASLTSSSWIFAAAVLHMSLADGLAAIIGITYGKTNRYEVFGQTKSVAGTGTFIVVSFLLVLGFLAVSPSGFQQLAVPFVVVWVPIAAAILENTSIMGTDNITVPLVVVTVLTFV
jgi:phytol kinase